MYINGFKKTIYFDQRMIETMDMIQEDGKNLNQNGLW
jgi:hypothetical protein